MGIRWGGMTSREVDDHLAELALLAETAGAEIVGQIVQLRNKPDSATFIGKGKAESLMRQANELKCDLIIIDDELTPSQQKNLQKLAGEEIKVIDRSALILDIFAKHARTRTAKTQVELARLRYFYPRLTGQWTHLERQKGGIGTRGGMGESQIEVDRRMTRTKMRQLERELVRIETEMQTQSRRRSDAFRVALVGYTNAGKSTLMNALTDADVYVEDQLFATLDTTTRKLELDTTHTILISDTVGFIRKLPHHLVASFRSTLTEVAEADLILKILDASSMEVREHHQAIEIVLADMDIGEKPSLVVLNKLDAVPDDGTLSRLKQEFDGALVISARDHLRIDRLEQAILDAYSASFTNIEFRIPSGEAKLLAFIYNNLDVIDREFEDADTILKVSGSEEVIETVRARLAQI